MSALYLPYSLQMIYIPFTFVSCGKNFFGGEDYLGVCLAI